MSVRTSIFITTKGGKFSMCRCDRRREAVEDTREISTKCGLRKCRTGFMKSSGLTGLT